MKKAFLFSVIFILIFTTLILLSVFYLRMMQMNEIALAQSKNITRILYVRDDIASDILDYLQLSVSIQSNSTNTILNISDTLPSPYSNPSISLTAYKAFINGTYSNETNLLNSTNTSVNYNSSVINLTTTAFENAPSLQFISSNSSLSLNYSYNNLSKNELIINGSSLVTNYSIAITFNDTCLNNNCTNATWAGGPPNIDSSTAGMWHFDEGGSNTTANDSSGNGNNCNVNGAAWNFSGKYGKALQFDGSTAYLDCLNSSTFKFNVTNNFTVEAWVNPTLDSSYRVIVGNSWTTPGYKLFITIDNRTRFALYTSGSNYNYSETDALSAGWHHIAGVWNGTNVTTYLDGSLNSTPSGVGTVGDIVSTYNLTIGNLQGESRYFKGTIDEVAIYSRAKSASEIAADANLFHWDWSPIAMNSNLSAAWHFDDGTGTTTADSSGNGNTGTLPTSSMWNFSGKFNSALTFTGSQTVNVNYSSTLDATGNLTVEAWIKSQNILSANYQTILFKGNSTAENYGLYLRGSNLYFEWNSSGVNSLNTSSANLQNNTWYHVAAVFNSVSHLLILYINGVNVGTNTTTSGIVANTGNLTIGANNSNNYFNGTIDEVAIYNRAKSAVEIAADANPLYISTNLRDSLNNSIPLRGSTAGYVNAGANNTFYIKTNGGNLNMTVGAYSSLYSLRAYVNSTQVNILTTITESGVSSMQAVLPIQLRIYQQTFSNLIIAEK